MKLNHRLLKRLWDVAKLPFAKKHADRSRAARIKRNAHIRRRQSKRIGFKRFWRSLEDHPAMRGQSRRYRRALALLWYRESK